MILNYRRSANYLPKFANHRPADPFIDVDMPRMNGIEFVRKMRADRRYETLPVVIVSYKDREEDRIAGLEAGASAYLTKGSFQDQSFLQTIADLIGAAV